MQECDDSWFITVFKIKSSLQVRSAPQAIICYTKCKIG